MHQTPANSFYVKTYMAMNTIRIRICSQYKCHKSLCNKWKIRERWRQTYDARVLSRLRTAGQSWREVGGYHIVHFGKKSHLRDTKRQRKDKNNVLNSSHHLESVLTEADGAWTENEEKRVNTAWDWKERKRWRKKKNSDGFGGIETILTT